ncbi:MAG: hypothetical protein J5943_11345 [Oribacterium sp.]|nr:hypothetical protein [Oribacterium sp.]
MDWLRYQRTEYVFLASHNVVAHFGTGAFNIAILNVFEDEDMFLGGFFVAYLGFRNAVNLGLVPVICKGISKKVKEGQTLTGISSYCFCSTIPHIIRLPP